MRELPEDPERSPRLVLAARLDMPYIATRYPDALPEGTDIAEAYDAKGAQESIAVAEGTLARLQQWGGKLGVPTS